MYLFVLYSYRFPDLFPDIKEVRSIQRELDEIIQQGVFNIIRLLKAEEAINEEENNAKRTNKSIYYTLLFEK